MPHPAWSSTIALLLVACAPDAPCTLKSTVDGFEPDCDQAAMGLLEAESRFVLPAADGHGAVIAHLPTELAEITYGGTSGEYLLVILELDGQEAAAHARTSSLEVVDLGEEEVGLTVRFEFDAGAITGQVSADVTGP